MAAKQDARGMNDMAILWFMFIEIAGGE